ncbi:MAG: copper resistance protein CopC [Methylocapsa sp.]|nr:copper resistance protein CopC [Methylocapsa sp.]
MDRRHFIATAAGVAVIAFAAQAFARFMGGAYLDHAVPGVGLTVAGSPRELRLYFNLGVIAAASKVAITNAFGVPVAAGRPVNDSADPAIVIVSLKSVLLPGTYNVSWHVVSIHGRATSGTFRFTVA